MKTNPTVTDPAALSPVMTTHATAKGQIVIPAKLRRKSVSTMWNSTEQMQRTYPLKMD